MLKVYRSILIWLLRLDPSIAIVTVITKKDLKQAMEWMNQDMFEPVKITESQDQVVH